MVRRRSARPTCGDGRTAEGGRFVGIRTPGPAAIRAGRSGTGSWRTSPRAGSRRSSAGGWTASARPALSWSSCSSISPPAPSTSSASRTISTSRLRRADGWRAYWARSPCTRPRSGATHPGRSGGRPGARHPVGRVGEGPAGQGLARTGGEGQAPQGRGAEDQPHRPGDGREPPDDLQDPGRGVPEHGRRTSISQAMTLDSEAAVLARFGVIDRRHLRRRDRRCPCPQPVPHLAGYLATPTNQSRAG